MSAFTPLLELVFKRNSTDPELDELGEAVLEGLQLLGFVNNALAGKRRDNLSPLYAKTMSKGQDPSSEWLYGGDLVETTKKCEASKRIGEKVLKRKPLNPQQRGRGANMKRFRHPFPVMIGQPVRRLFFQGQMGQFRFPGPQAFAQFPQ